MSPLRPSCSSLLAVLAGLATAGCATDPAPPEDDEGARFEEAWRDVNSDKGDGTGACSGAKPPDSGPFAKRVALTFDDGPNPETTPQIIEILRAHGAPATFFINGWRVGTTLQPGGDTPHALLEEIAADPLFKVGNHTWWHEDMRTLDADRRAHEIDDTRDLIAATGEPLGFFRFPFGASTCTTAAEARARGYRVTGWHVDSADWCFQKGHGTCSPDTFAYVPDAYRHDMLAYTLDQVRSHQGGIVLFHDIHPGTAAHLDAFLDALEAEGYAFVALDDEGTFPVLNGAPPTFIGDACEASDDCTFEDGVCLGAEAGAGRCTRACTTSCPDQAGYGVTRCAVLGDPDDAGGDADLAMDLCALECGAGDRCPAALTCHATTSPAGLARKVCW